MAASINIESNEIRPKTDIRVLGLQIDTKLRWGPHVQKTQEKMVKQSMALSKISTSTWGATFSKARQVYTAVVRPAMTYGSAVWHTPKEVKKSLSTSKLATMQNNCLRTIAGAFKATPIPVLEAETFIAPIDIHLNHLQAKARYRLRVGGQAKVISTAYKTIVNKLRGRAGRTRVQQPTPGDKKHSWAKDLLPPGANNQIIVPPDIHPPWSEPPSVAYMDKVSAANTARNKHLSVLRKHHLGVWTASWNAYQNQTPKPTVAQAAPWGKIV